MRRSDGFTLVELLLVIMLLGSLVAISLPVYAQFQTRNDLGLTTESVVNMLRRAQTYARGVNGDSQWGVAVQAGTATLFKGSSYAGRDTTYDETATISGSIVPSGLSEVVFSKLQGAPATTGSITLTANTNDIRTITINGKGTVSY